MTDLDMREIARVTNLMLDPTAAIFVFGSNRAGIHGAGAALSAVKFYGAVYGQGEGLQGRSYAVPTKDEHLKTLPLYEIGKHVKILLGTAMMNPHVTYAVTRFGCGLAGYRDDEIAPLLKDAPKNCELPEGWRGDRHVFEQAPSGICLICRGQRANQLHISPLEGIVPSKQADGEPDSR